MKLIGKSKSIKVGKKGTLFELLVHRIENSIKNDETIIIETNKYIENIEGFKRQIDVFITSTINSYPIGIAIECKDHSKIIDVEKIESFKCKCQRIQKELL